MTNKTSAADPTAMSGVAASFGVESHQVSSERHGINPKMVKQAKTYEPRDSPDEVLPAAAALSTLWLEINRLGLTLKKPSTLMNNVVLISRLRGVGGASRCRSTMQPSTSSSTSQA